MKFFGSVVIATVILGTSVLATSMVMDMMDNDRFWHQIKPGNGN